MSNETSYMLMSFYLYVLGAYVCYMVGVDDEDTLIPTWVAAAGWPVIIPLIILLHVFGIAEVGKKED